MEGVRLLKLKLEEKNQPQQTHRKCLNIKERMHARYKICTVGGFILRALTKLTPQSELI